MSREVNWKPWFGFAVLFVFLSLAAAHYFKLAVLTALPIGFLFGFFLQKGDLCGASAFSEVVLMKSWAKVFGIWVVIVVSMVGFALLNGFGIIAFAVKPMWWLNYLLGGTVFGIGMVLAGGCVSGCLFKAGMGNLNSIVALLSIPLGVSIVEYGPLNGLHSSMQTVTTTAPDGRPLSLFALLGLPYWVLSLGFFGVTVLGVWLWRRRHPPHRMDRLKSRRFRDWMTRPWRPWQAGVAIGLLAMAAYVSSAASGRNYPLGVTHGVLFAQVLMTDADVRLIYEKPDPSLSSKGSTQNEGNASKPGKKVNLWLVLLISAIVLGSHTSARMSGQARLLPKPPEQILVAMLGGFLVGTGAALAKGCVVGNIMSGWALMSLGTVWFGMVTLLANWATTYLYHLGGMAGKAQSS